VRNTMAIAGKGATLLLCFSPIGLLVTAVFLVITGYFFAMNIVNAQEALSEGSSTPQLRPAASWRLF